MYSTLCYDHILVVIFIQIASRQVRKFEPLSRLVTGAMNGRTRNLRKIRMVEENVTKYSDPPVLDTGFLFCDFLQVDNCIYKNNAIGL